MPPRKNKRRFEDDEDELDRKEENSKWAKLLQTHEEEEQEDTPKKEIFQFDFSKEHRLLNQKEPPRKEEPKIELTPEEKEALDRALEKQRKEKEEKERVRREKKQEKQRMTEKEKEEEQVKRESEVKEEKELEDIVNKQKANTDSRKILIVLVVILVGLGLLQYQKDIYARLSKFRIASDVNFYEVLQISSGASEQELKNQYKRLVVKYHPDKNPNCHSCTEKFNSIMQAWEVLGNFEKRKHYDQNSGFITQIPSSSLQLTPDNYQWLLGDSDWLWVVQVYDSTEQFCHYFAPFWEEFAKKYEGLVRVGRIDVWQQSQMKSYVPYKFQIFPGLYSMHRGQDSLCQLDYERPMRSLELCVDTAAQDSGVTRIGDWSMIPPHEGKIAVILGSEVKLSAAVKLIHLRFSRYLSFFQMNQGGGKTVQVKGRDFRFELDSVGNKKIFKKYGQFLEGLTVQSKTGCQIHQDCRERPCLLVLDDQAYLAQQKLMPFPAYRVVADEFLGKVQEIKNVTGMFQKFQVGCYQDGKIELGYFNELQDLNPQNGEVFDFACRKEDIFMKIGKGWKAALSMIVSQ